MDLVRSSATSFDELRVVAEGAARIVLREFRPPAYHAFNLPNNIIGRLILQLLRRYLNRQVYKLVPRGRTPKVKGARRYSRYGLRLDQSKVLAVYVQLKHPYDKE